MTTIERHIGLSGTLGTRLIRAPGPGLRWRLQNILRVGFVRGLIGAWLARPFSRVTGVMTAHGTLSAVLRKADGRIVNYGVVGYLLVTNAAVAALVDDMDDSTVDITNFNYHGVGTGNTAEAQGDTALVTESTTALNPDSTRATGTKSQPSANVLRTVGTVIFDAAAAIVEHGLFSQAATGGGTLWDRTVFAAINVGVGDSIQFTYDLTVNAGG